MKMKSWIALVAGRGVPRQRGSSLFGEPPEKRRARFALARSKQQAADLQAQLDQLKNSIADAQNAEISKLRADNQDLPRLRNQVTQLHGGRTRN